MTDEMKVAAGTAIQTCVAHLRNLGDDATQAHWNVQGMAGPLHKLFGKLPGGLWMLSSFSLFWYP